MKKRLFIAIIISIFLSIILSFSTCFAANDMSAVDGIRNFVGGAENVIEDAGSGIVNGVKSGVDSTRNMTEDMGNSMARTTRTNDNNYTAQRTSSVVDATDGNFLGLSTTMWTWIIMALVGIAIVVLVWAYSKENHYDSHHDNDL